jgi:cobaltochelatase CobT
MRHLFETTLQKLGRIISNEYNLGVVFEGANAYTDGKTIHLPSTAELSEELQKDMHGFLDHEVAHCRFSDFDALKKKLITEGRGARFHKELTNAVEDSRVEIEMIKDLPGCELNLVPLHEKCNKKLREGWKKIPWPIQLIVSIRDIYDGKTPTVEAEYADLLENLDEEIADLKKSKSTGELVDVTRRITEKVIERVEEEEKEEEKEEKKEKKSDSSEKGDGEGEGGSGEGDSDDDDSDDGEEKNEGKKSKKEKNGEKKSKGDKEILGEKEMLDDSAEGEKKWKKVQLSIEDAVNKELAKELGTKFEQAGHEKPETTIPQWVNPEFKGGKPHIPFTTRFDKERDFSGKGDKTVYNELLGKVKRFVGPMKKLLEQHLKVMENSKWFGEQERGQIDNRSLSKLAVDKNFRLPFKKKVKNETNNVAIEMLVDMSGSMNGRIETARLTLIAVAESLKELAIPFEVTGFYSISDSNLSREASGIANSARMGGFYNRVTERLEKHIFKTFDCNDLSGITKVNAYNENPDSEAVQWAANRLSMQKQKRKILIVFSDGQPCTSEGVPSILNTSLRSTVQKIIKSGIEVVGFGIQTRSVQEFYPDNLVINSLENLPTEVFGKFSKILRKRG